MTTQARELAKIVNNAGDLFFVDDVALASDGAVLNFGADNDVTLTHVADTGLLINSSRQLQFGDSGTFIRQEADGVLDLTSDTEIELNATTLDINANVDISGTLTVAGALDFGDAAISNVGALQLDSIAGDADTNTSITFSGSDVITVATGGSTALTVDASQRVGIGTTSPSSKLQVIGAIQSADGSGGSATLSSTGSIELKRSGGAFIDFATGADEDKDCRIIQSSNGLNFETGGEGSTAVGLSIDSSQKVSIGAGSPSGKLHVYGHTSSVASIFESSGNGDTVPVQLKVKANDGTTSTQGLYGNAGSGSANNTITFGNGSNDGLTIDASGQAEFKGTGNLVTFNASSGVTYVKFAENGTSRFFLATLNGSDGLAFVDADGGSTRMKIFDDGDIGLGGAETGNIINSSSGVGFYHERGADTIVGRNGGAALSVLRQSSDGELIRFKQAGSQEGSINVSGSTVSLQGFTGTHETSGIADDTAIGTVVSTIDELDTYVSGSKDGQTRAEHPKVKVSDSVGDSRVYGVLQSRTESDNKPLIASVGLGTILVTGACSGGDLLESNGDGTAKVQDDDIIRSKTIGKVTIGDSNTGVKSVSCVLYCG